MSVDNDKVEATIESLTAYAVGQIVSAAGAELAEGKTKPPPRYSQDSLIRDMENASKFARSPEERAMLKQTEGIGTARTRDPTLQGLLRRGLLTSKKVGKRHELYSADIGRQLVGRLPSWLVDVATTAKWETLLSAIEKGGVEADSVLNSQIEYIKQVVDRAKTQIKAPKAP